MDVGFHAIAREHLRYHEESVVVAGVAHDDRVGTVGSADADVREGSRTARVGGVVPCGTGAAKLPGERVPALHHGVAKLDLVDGPVPREVLTNREADGSEGVAEVEPGSRGYALRGIVHVPAAGCHEVHLPLHVRLCREVHSGAAGRSGGADGQLRVALLRGEHGEEAGMGKRPCPPDGAVELPGTACLCGVEPLGGGQYVVFGIAAQTRRGEVAVDGSLYIGTGARVGLHGVHALDGGLYQADVETAVTVCFQAVP